MQVKYSWWFSDFCVILLAVILLTISSCKKFLQVESPNFKIPTEEIFSSDDNANSALAGMYLEMQYFDGGVGIASGGKGSLSWLSGLSADVLHSSDANLPPSVIAFEQSDLQPDNSYIKTLWSSIYRTIYQANAILHGIELSTSISALKKQQFSGEALFVRAFCYFYLTNLFGEVPIAITKDYQLNSKLAKTSQSNVYDQIEKDLLDAEMLLSDASLTIEHIRPDKSAARALLSRVYLYRKKWQEAEGYANKIIIREDLYKMPTDLNAVFTASSNEAIWQLKPTDGVLYTDEGQTFDISIGPRNNILTNTLVNAFSNVDLRITKWIIGVGSGSDKVFLPYKYKRYSNAGSLPSEYYMVLRLSEQHLIRAEARAQLGIISGNNSALSDLNIIRKRAGLADTVAYDLPQVMGIIERERQLELFNEWGHRWLDLKRWHRSTDVLAPLKPRWNNTDTLYPIPQSEINKNPSLKPQNPGYF